MLIEEITELEVKVKRLRKTKRKLEKSSKLSHYSRKRCFTVNSRIKQTLLWNRTNFIGSGYEEVQLND